MATSYKGQADRVHIPAAGAARVQGVPVIESQWAGIALTTAASGAPYTLAVEGEFELTFVASSVVGDWIMIAAADNAITRVATLPGAGTARRLFAKVTAVPGSSGTGTYGNSPVSGKMWVKILSNDAQLPALYA